MSRIPRDRNNDYSEDAVRSRREFIAEQTGARFSHQRVSSQESYRRNR